MFKTLKLDQEGSDNLKAAADIWINPGEIRLTDSSYIEQPSAPVHGVFCGPEGITFGAYSYSWSLIGMHVKSVGRYCSFGGWITFGDHEHPTGWLTTSNIPWDPNFMTSAHARRKNPDLPVRPQKSVIGPIEIGNDVWIGSRAYIKRGVKIGDGAIIGTHAVVTKDVPPFAIVAGNTARVKRYRFDEETIAIVQEAAWWQYDYADIGDLDFSNPAAACKAIIERAASGELKPFWPKRLEGSGLS